MLAMVPKPMARLCNYLNYAFGILVHNIYTAFMKLATERFRKVTPLRGPVSRKEGISMGKRKFLNSLEGCTFVLAIPHLFQPVPH